jgi:hypothetical protein
MTGPDGPLLVVGISPAVTMPDCLVACYHRRSLPATKCCLPRRLRPASPVPLTACRPHSMAAGTGECYKRPNSLTRSLRHYRHIRPAWNRALRPASRRPGEHRDPLR